MWKLPLLCVVVVGISLVSECSSEAQIRPGAHPAVRGPPRGPPPLGPGGRGGVKKFRGIQFRHNNAAALFKSMFSHQQRRKGSMQKRPPPPPPPHRSLTVVPDKGQLPQRRGPPRFVPPRRIASNGRPGRQTPPHGGNRPPPPPPPGTPLRLGPPRKQGPPHKQGPPQGQGRPPLPLAPNPYLKSTRVSKPRPPVVRGPEISTTTQTTTTTISTTTTTTTTTTTSGRGVYPPVGPVNSVWNPSPARYGGSVQPPAPPVDPKDTLYREQSIYKSSPSSSLPPKSDEGGENQDSTYPFGSFDFFGNRGSPNSDLDQEASADEGSKQVSNNDNIKSNVKLPSPQSAPTFQYTISTTSTIKPAPIRSKPTSTYTSFNKLPESSTYKQYESSSSSSPSPPIYYISNSNEPSPFQPLSQSVPSETSISTTPRSQSGNTYKVISSAPDADETDLSNPDAESSYPQPSPSPLQSNPISSYIGTPSSSASPQGKAASKNNDPYHWRQVDSPSADESPEPSQYLPQEPRDNGNSDENNQYGAPQAPTFTYSGSTKQEHTPPTYISNGGSQSFKMPSSQGSSVYFKPSSEEGSGVGQQGGGSSFAQANVPSSSTYSQTLSVSEPVENVFTPGPVYYKSDSKTVSSKPVTTTTKAPIIYYQPISNSEDDEPIPSYNNAGSKAQPSFSYKPSSSSSSSLGSVYSPKPATATNNIYGSGTQTKEAASDPNNSDQPSPPKTQSETKKYEAQENEELASGFGFQSGEFKIPDFFRNFLSAPPAWINVKDW